MPLVSLTLDDLEHAVERLHALFEEMEHEPVLPLDAFTTEVLKLALHEWIANLVQHARFGDHAACIRLTISPEGEQVRCVVEDSSEGFDLATQLRRQQSALDLPGEVPERGRGLLMLEACAEGLLYSPCRPDECDDGFRQRLQFLVAPSDTTQHGIALFPDVTDFLDDDFFEDLVLDEPFAPNGNGMPSSPSDSSPAAPAASTPASSDEA